MDNLSSAFNPILYTLLKLQRQKFFRMCGLSLYIKILYLISHPEIKLYFAPFCMISNKYKEKSHRQKSVIHDRVTSNVKCEEYL